MILHSLFFPSVVEQLSAIHLGYTNHKKNILSMNMPTYVNTAKQRNNATCIIKVFLKNEKQE